MIHLRLHDHYSIKRAYGMNFQKYHNPHTKSPFIEMAKELGMTHVGLSNYGNDYGFVNWWKGCKDAGVQPLFGIEFMVTNDMTSKGRPNFNHINNGNDTIILYAKNNMGYRDLMTINTIANKEEHYFIWPRIDYDFLSEYETENLVCIIPYDFGTIPKYLIEGNDNMALRLARMLQSQFGDDLYFELSSNVSPVNKIINEKMIALATKLGIKMVASSNVHYPKKKHKKIHDVLLAIGQKKTYAENNLYSLGADDHYFKSQEEVISGLEAMGIDYTDIIVSIANTHEVAEKCTFELTFPDIGIPDPPIPEGFTNESYFRHLIEEGWKKKILPRINSGEWDSIKPEDIPMYEERRDYEFNMIRDIFTLKDPNHSMKEGFIPYFLLVRDYVTWAKGIDRRILHDAPIVEVGPARGSVSGSLLGYLTDLTTVDPMPYGLTFERFINPERVSWPDIDMDFDPENAWWVEQYLIQTYGWDRVAHIITFQTMAAKMSFDNTVKVFTGNYGKFKEKVKPEFWKSESELKALVPMTKKQAEEIKAVMTDEPIIEQITPDHPNFNPALYEYYQISAYKEMFDIMAALQGTVSSTGSHPGACIVTKDPIWYHCSKTNNGGEYPDGSVLYVTAYEKYNCEEVNTMKYDILRLAELTIVKNAKRFIKQSTGIDVALDKINPYDKDTNMKILKLYKDLDTNGIFQFSSKLYQGIIEEVLANLEHLDQEQVASDLFNIIVALEALGRPGPLEGGMVQTFAQGLSHPDQVPEIHPVVDEILKETYGNMLYQEQLMFILMRLGGFSLGQADMVRRGIASGDINKIEAQRQPYMEGVKRVQLEKNPDTTPEDMDELLKLANSIFDLMTKWAGYGFNKAHSVGYGVLSYQGSWLKVNYKTQFMAALLSQNAGDETKIVKFINGLKARGVRVLPPKINKSGTDFTVVGEDILFGLPAIKGVGEKAVENIVQGYPYTNILDFMRRTSSKSVGKGTIGPLVKAGYFEEDQKFLLKYWEALYSFRKGETRIEENLIDFIEENGFHEGTYQEIEKRIDMIIREKISKKRTEKTKAEVAALIDRTEYSKIQLLDMEKEVLGMYLSASPLDAYNDLIYKYTVIQKDIKKHNMKTEIFIVGVLTDMRAIKDKNGNDMCFLNIQMVDGLQDCVVFKETYAKYKSILIPGKVLIMKGKKGKNDGFQAISIANLEEKEDVFRQFFNQREGQTG